MPYAFVEDIAASWEHYERFAAALEGVEPEGLILHAAGPTDEGFRIIGIWESEDAWRRFGEERLDPGAEAEAPSIFRALRATHVVARGAGTTTSWPAPTTSRSCSPDARARTG